MKKIFFVVDLQAFGGVETVLITMLSLLKDKYCCFVICTVKMPSNIVNILSEYNIQYYDIDIKKFHIENYILQKISRIIKKVFLAIKLYFIIDCNSVIIDFKNGISTKFIKLFSGKSKKIVWLHGGRKFLQNLKTDILFYDKIVCITDDACTFLHFKYPHKKNIIRIYNPLVLTSKHFEPILSQHKDEYFCHISRIDKDKDIKTLIDAYEKFYKSTKSKTKLYIIGDGPEKEYYEDYAIKQTSASQILFTGYQQYPFLYMKFAKAVVLSSPSEGLPCILIEALSTTEGVVISSDCPSGPQEILEGGKCGLLFPVQDSTTLSQYLYRIELGEITKKQFLPYISSSLNRFTPEKFFLSFDKLIMSLNYK